MGPRRSTDASYVGIMTVRYVDLGAGRKSIGERTQRASCRYSRPMKTTRFTIATACGLALMMTGCGKKDEKSEDKSTATGSKTDKPKKDEPKKDGFSTEAGELIVAGTKVEMQLPVGWTRNPLGDDSVYLVSPNGNWLWVASTCAGSCSSLAENMSGLATKKTAEFESAKYTVETLKDEATDDGRVVHLKLTKNDKTMFYRDRMWLNEGWKSFISCAYVGKNDQDNEIVDEIAKICDAAKISYAK